MVQFEGAIYVYIQPNQLKSHALFPLNIKDSLELSCMFVLQCILPEDVRFVMHFNGENTTDQTWVPVTARCKLHSAKN